MKSHRRTNNKRILVAILIATVLVAAGVAVIYYKRASDNRAQTTSDSISPEEKQRIADEQKSDTAEKEAQAKEEGSSPGDGSSTDLQNVTVAITYVGESDSVIEVNAFTEHYADGTCTIVFTQGNLNVTRSTPAYRDASTTICTNPMISRSEFPQGGTWSVVVNYSTNGVQGKSQAQSIDLR